MQNYMEGVIDASYLTDLTKSVHQGYKVLPVKNSSYFGQQSKEGNSMQNELDPEVVYMNLRKEINAWGTGDSNPKLPDHDFAHQIIVSITNTSKGLQKTSVKTQSGSAPVIFSTTGEADIQIPLDFQRKLRDLSQTCSELLRHFWACTPPRSGIAKKRARVKGRLDLFYKDIQKVKTQLHSTGKSKLVPLLRDLEHSVNRIFEEHEEYERLSNNRNMGK